MPDAARFAFKVLVGRIEALEAKYLRDKARKDRWAWNFGIQQGRPITVRENRQWKPVVVYSAFNTHSMHGVQ